ncbi:MAG: cytochrome c1 [Tagaea sp. CACIAM 22H2]|jgi:ubiquinol-cytochrome c reductase cytochrome c1 subunit|nr:cytochrome c1 [Tagaea sp. CACIAM 22H2]
MRTAKLLIASVLAFGLGLGAASAAEAPKPPAQKWAHTGFFGTFDRAELQRGFQVYKEVCAACHAMHQIRYRNLAGIGLSEAEIAAIAKEYEVTDGPNDEGEMFQRPARASDRFKSPFPNQQAARAANGGAYPPDLSLIAKNRVGGENYVYALLTGYKETPPAGVTLMDGMYYNDWFAGHQIGMAPPLSDDRVTYADGTKATLAQQARDVSVFLAWAASPHLEARNSLGVKVMIFLIILAGLLYATKRKVWRDIKH